MLAYGRTVEEAISKVEALGLRVIADRFEHGETGPALLNMQPRIGKMTGLRPEDL